MTTAFRVTVVAAGLLAAMSVASAQVTRESLIRPQPMRVSGRSAAVGYVTVDATKQGRFKGQGLAARWQGAVPVVGFSYEVTQPRELVRAGANGGRAHGPVVLTMPIGAATPQFFSAMADHENLKSVLIQFVRTDANGAEEVFYTIKLTNATASRFRQYLDTESGGVPGSGLVAEVSLAFDRIEVSSLDGGTMAMDDSGR
jgi:type VI secretion system secreted protein Hcp